MAAALPLPLEAPKPLPAAPELSLRDAIFPLAPAGKRKTKHRKRRRRRAGKRLRAETRRKEGAGACALLPPLSPHPPPPPRGVMAAVRHGPRPSPGGTGWPSLGLANRHGRPRRSRRRRRNPVPCARRRWPSRLSRPGTGEGPRGLASPPASPHGGRRRINRFWEHQAVHFRGFRG